MRTLSKDFSILGWLLVWLVTSLSMCPTCSPENSSLLIVGIKGLGERMGLLQAVQQLEEVLGRHELVHALILRLDVDICIQCVLLEGRDKTAE